MPDVFLSYSRDDQTTARRFAEGLERAGFTVFNVRRGYYRATGDDALEMERLL